MGNWEYVQGLWGGGQTKCNAKMEKMHLQLNFSLPEHTIPAVLQAGSTFRNLPQVLHLNMALSYTSPIKIDKMRFWEESAMQNNAKTCVNNKFFWGMGNAKNAKKCLTASEAFEDYAAKMADKLHHTDRLLELDCPQAL